MSNPTYLIPTKQQYTLFLLNPTNNTTNNPNTHNIKIMKLLSDTFKQKLIDLNVSNKDIQCAYMDIRLYNKHSNKFTKKHITLKVNSTYEELLSFIKEVDGDSKILLITGIIWLNNGNYIHINVTYDMNITFDYQYNPEIPDELK